MYPQETGVSYQQGGDGTFQSPGVVYTQNTGFPQQYGTGGDVLYSPIIGVPNPSSGNAKVIQAVIFGGTPLCSCACCVIFWIVIIILITNNSLNGTALLVSCVLASVFGCFAVLTCCFAVCFFFMRGVAL